MDPSHLRPLYPTLQTPSNTSAFQSSTSSLSSLSSHSSTMSPTSPTTRQMAAPLPSPTVSAQPQQYFGSMHAGAVQQRLWAEQSYQQGVYAQSQAAPQKQSYPQHYPPQQPYAPQYAQVQQYPPQTQAAAARARVEGYHYQPDRSGAGSTAQETARYLSEAELVAEAARRAQMAVLMRDFEGVELR